MSKKIDYQKELNPAQLEAVQSTEGPHLVIAGAGSGKTRTLVFRVAYLVEKGVKPDEILLLTFTRKASQEMLRRASMLLDERCNRVAGGTFHSFANMVLRKYGSVLGIPSSFTIMDEADAEDTINLVRAQLGFNKTDKRFPRKATILDIISKGINKSEEIGIIIYDEYPQFMEWEDEVKKIAVGYSSYKKEHGLLDYDDLLVNLRNLLSQNEHLRQVLSSQYRYIMVDEYQDTNKLQAHIACLLAGAHKNIMVVGDDSQSIYAFRGAHFKNIIGFPRLFPNTKVITLEENFRSTQPILDLANELISGAKEKFEKNLFTRKQGKGVPVFVDARDEHAQSRFIADRILELREDGSSLGDIAVLFRSSWHSNDLEVELAGRNIPFVKYGGQRFVEAAHIKDLLAYLRVLHNLRDEVSWYRILLLMKGIGAKTAEKILKDRGTSFTTDEKFIAKFPELKKLFDLFSRTQQSKASPDDLVKEYLEFYAPLMKEKYDDFPKRVNDFDSLIRIAGRYETLESFLADMAIEPPERNLIEPGRRDRDDLPLTLSTIHSAKGLEWKTVFIVYVAEGHLPSYLSLENEDQIEEERRLFYVAVTRAKDNLFLLKPHLDRSPRSGFEDGGLVFTRVSRFLEEGDILGRLIRREDITEPEFIEPDELSSSRSRRRVYPEDKEFLRMIKEHFDN